MSAEQIQEWLEIAGAGGVKPSGDNLISRCPFHPDSKRSFSMNVNTGQYICFSQSCGMQGGLYSFLIEGCGYTRDKARSIADDWQSSFEGRGTEAGWDIDFPAWACRRRATDDELKTSIDEHLLGLYDFCPKYMTEQRGFDRETLRKWEIGYDFETKTVTLPVRDAAGELIGMSKRMTSRSPEHPYLHLGFKRSKVLYGEFFCPKDAEVWTTEGQLDTLALSQMGVDYPVSTMSARVGPAQIRKLSRYPRVVLAFDNDANGRRAAILVGDALLESGHPDVRVARSFSGYNDPAEILKKGGKRAARTLTSKTERYDLVRVDWFLVGS